MNTNRKFKIKPPFFIVTCSFIAAHLLTWLMPGIFETLNSLAIDQLFKYRYQSKYFRPYYDETIVHVDLNNASINQLNQFYLNRSHHAKVISNLSSMKVGFQLYDFIFAAPSNKEEDSSLINAVSEAKNIYFGLAFEMERAGKTKKSHPRNFSSKKIS